MKQDTRAQHDASREAGNAERLGRVPAAVGGSECSLEAALSDLKRTTTVLQDTAAHLEETNASFEALQREHRQLSEEMAMLKRLLYGPRRERFPESPGQQHLFDKGVPETPRPSESAEEEETGGPSASSRSS
jgi:hypothetical protein